MSASNIFASSSPVTAGSRFASPWVKGVAAGLAVVGLFGGYVLLRDNVQTLAAPASAPPPEPTAQISHNVTPFTPMPPAVEMAPVRPTARAPLAAVQQSTGTGGATVSRDMLAYNAQSLSGGSGGTRISRADSGDAPDDPPGTKKKDAPSALAASVTPTKFSATSVAELPHPDYLIEQGRHIPCTQMTVINTTYAGSVTAILPSTIRGETGDVELLGAGSKIFGTIEHGMTNGAARAFVLWQNITTPLVRDRYGVPHQFRIEVNSPASSELGETGMDGDVNRHLLTKIGGVIGVSLVQGLSEGLANSMTQKGNNNNSFSFNMGSMQSGTESAANMLAQQFVAIPDILTRLQGKGCEVALVRDLDLSAAYPELRTIMEIQRGRR